MFPRLQGALLPTMPEDVLAEIRQAVYRDTDEQGVFYGKFIEFTGCCSLLLQCGLSCNPSISKVFELIV